MDEIEKTQETVSDNVEEVNDADLDAAFNEFMGYEEPEPIEEQVETKLEPEVPQTLIHSESSRIGRKVKRIEEQMVSKEELNNLNSKLDMLLSQLNRKPSEPQYDEYGQEIKPEVDIDALVEQKIVQVKTREQQAAAEASKKYQNGYIDTLRDMIDEIDDPVVAREVWKKMTTPGSEFNQKYSENPYTDCSKNFIKAVKSVKTPFGGKRGSSLPTGVTTTTTNTDSIKKVPKLDAEAEEFIKSTGMSEEDILSALEGEVPSRLKGVKLHL